jgi:hypothetical protein
MSRDPLAANLRANVPGELRAVEGWVVWSWTDGKKEPDCAPDLSRHASSTDAAPGHLSTNASPSLSPATLTASDSRSTRSPMTSSCSTSTRRCPRSTGWRLLSRWTPTHRTVAIGRRTARRLPHEAERFRLHPRSSASSRPAGSSTGTRRHAIQPPPRDGRPSDGAGSRLGVMIVRDGERFLGRRVRLVRHAAAAAAARERGADARRKGRSRRADRLPRGGQAEPRHRDRRRPLLSPRRRSLVR